MGVASGYLSALDATESKRRNARLDMTSLKAWDCLEGVGGAIGRSYIEGLMQESDSPESRLLAKSSAGSCS